MASVIHAASPPGPPPTFSRMGTDNSMHGLPLSQSSINSFDAPKSAVNTPTPTPPASRGNHHAMSYNGASFGPPNGYHPQQNTLRGYGDVNGNVSAQYPPGQQPQIYTAVYSGVSVYEMEIHGVAIMRRRKDSWLNATQILKVAGIDKGKRTKVLEKEILAGIHEKVQGGYGKYQGTWIDYPRGVQFCRQYGVEELLRPLLQYDMGQDGVTMAGQGSVDTPTKEQAMAAQRKRNMLSGGIDNRPNGNSPNGTFFKSISKTAANAVSAIHKARFESPVPRLGTSGNRPGPARRPSQQIGSQESAFAGSSQQSLQSMQSDNVIRLDPALRDPYYSNSQDQHHNADLNEPPRKRARPSSSHDPFGYDEELSMTLVDDSMQLANNYYHQSQHGSLSASKGLAPLQPPTNRHAFEKQQLLTSLFLDQTRTDFSNHPALLQLSGEELDMPIDGTAHTALHWAATLARPALIRALIRKGASIFRLNTGGETALIRAALTTNNMDNSTFPELLELLGATIEIRDGRGRTVLHHIAVSSAVHGRGPACQYYLHSLLEFVVRQGSAQNSFCQSQEANAPGPMKFMMSLAKFMNEIVNSPDMSGDTALNLAARINNKSIIQQLFEIGADPTIANRGGLKPVDFGVGGEPQEHELKQVNHVSKQNTKDRISKVNESSQDLMNSMTSLLTSTDLSFRSELTKKQSLIDATHTKLRENTSQLGHERRRLSGLKQRADARKVLRTQVANLRRANQERATAAMQHNEGALQPNIKVGEADAGLAIDTSLLPSRDSPATAFSNNQINTLSSLPTPYVIAARIIAYQSTNKRLQQQAKDLRAKSSILEADLKKVVGLSIGVEEKKVEEMAVGIASAVESERDEHLEVGRVRDFLRAIEGGAGEIGL